MSKSMNVISKYKESNKAFSKLSYELDKKIFSNKIRRFKNKLITNPFLNPIKWYKDREMKKFRDEMFKDENTK